VNRSWLKMALLVFAAALIIPQLAGQAKPAAAVPRLTPSELTLRKAMGSPNAPITVEIFSDYQCPACREMYLDTTRQIIDNYVSTGKVYLVHRDFPLNMHSHSQDAARWLNAVAAASTRSFPAAEIAVYTKQDDWGASGNVEQVLAATLPAADMKKVREAEIADRAEIDAAIRSDLSLGNTRNVTGTPSIFVIPRGKAPVPLPSGPVPYQLLKQYLDSLLRQP
jgi:protein-disulfide isomerase